jgi:hypothetical protein
MTPARSEELKDIVRRLDTLVTALQSINDDLDNIRDAESDDEDGNSVDAADRLQEVWDTLNSASSKILDGIDAIEETRKL